MWQATESRPFVGGQFIWTGFDYLGEPTPFPWPSRSSYFGLIDLCGFPKDCYYFYQSVWTDKPMLHVTPHWNWQADQIVDVWAYSNCDSVELLLNGKSLGEKLLKNRPEMHLKWKIPFEAGEILAIARKSGRECLRKTIRTASQAAKIQMIPNSEKLSNDSNDLCFIETRILDKNGTLVPEANHEITFTVSGAGQFLATDNGDPTSLMSFQSKQRQTFNGKCLLIIRSTQHAGLISIKAESEKLAAVITVISC
jgi:beta-galactosidase